ncbi:SusD/RagB family nutrient-binding outer membrane lipoprotein [Chitinophaga silvatica]|uniref:SusD/RagB family nutrient-binding outer membrane lipoprotein n=1 Tax=Chitinophaga silvatica TaxID=2282649 RepID=A0A3E1YEM2_9BACT|nr:SusD/RagB family nutrient-binding outer membrane lipoprotein [Chitinophaga silvatica]RFS24976.1 SusD/RagB family nutrient-binding outer membrane lipoprotein [Chitinophaga silvatica]
MKLFNILRQSTVKNIAITGLMATSLIACTKNFELYNTDNTGITAGQLGPDYNGLGLYLKSAQMAIYNFSGGGDPNSFQLQQNLNSDCYSGYFMSATNFNSGTNNLNYGLLTGWNGEAYKAGYLSLLAPIFKLRQTGIENTAPAVWGVGLIVKVAGMSRVTEIYGPIPYSKVGENLSSVPFDSQQSIYNRFFLELDTAARYLRTQISESKPLPFDFSSFDGVYNGNLTQWLKFANSLRLRLAMHIRYIDPAKAKAEAEAALDPVNGGVITDNVDNMTVKISEGFTNPLVFISKIWEDTHINASLQCYLTGYNDPRIVKYMSKSTDLEFAPQYLGIRIGSAVAKDKYGTYSFLNHDVFTLNTPVQLMTAAEVYFLRAEASLQGYNNAGGSSQQLYEQGITTSMNQWQVPIGDYLINKDSTMHDYKDPKNKANDAPAPSSITIKWDNAAPDSIKLQRIITQKWLAMFPEGQEAWTEFRRTGYPKLFTVVNNKSGGTIDTYIQIRRLPYPQNEYSTNPATVAEGVKLLGGEDNGGTRLWWDVKNK